MTGERDEMRLFDWWVGLSRMIRISVSLVVLALSALLWLAVPLFGGFIFPGWLLVDVAAVGWAIGFVLLMLSFPSKSERKGYHDF